MLVIRSHFYEYTVGACNSLSEALKMIDRSRAHYLIDGVFAKCYASDLNKLIDSSHAVVLEACEEAKSLERLPPVILDLIQRGLNRSGNLVVIGGGVLQDIGCFIASVLARGLRWEYIPTTLLAQADSCIGSKSSINIGPFKNQIGTFHAPHKVWLVSSVLSTLELDEIRSGFGEIFKFQLLKGEADFRELCQDVNGLIPPILPSLLEKWCLRSLNVKKTYIEKDEYDRGVRNVLNYGHTFGHAFETATHYAIPHGIAVLLGIVAATFISAQRGLATREHYLDVKKQLAPWYHPFQERLTKSCLEQISEAMARDKKNNMDGIQCILTRGFGQMEKVKLNVQIDLVPTLKKFLQEEI
jgi:3-dehydroquinate synthase